jgi:hypothetical protein
VQRRSESLGLLNGGASAKPTVDTTPLAPDVFEMDVHRRIRPETEPMLLPSWLSLQ